MQEPIQHMTIVPLFNEELVILETYKRMKKVMDISDEKYEIVFIDDVCKAATQNIVNEICRRDPDIKLISFSGHFSHQLAVTSGMDHTYGKAVVVIDANQQDSPETILEMIVKWKLGNEVIHLSA